MILSLGRVGVACIHAQDLSEHVSENGSFKSIKLRRRRHLHWPLPGQGTTGDSREGEQHRQAGSKGVETVAYSEERGREPSSLDPRSHM